MVVQSVTAPSRSWWSKLLSKHAHRHLAVKVCSEPLVDEEGDRCGTRYVNHCACGHVWSKSYRW
jgi:hypothetical protein